MPWGLIMLVASLRKQSGVGYPSRTLLLVLSALFLLFPHSVYGEQTHATGGPRGTALDREERERITRRLADVVRETTQTPAKETEEPAEPDPSRSIPNSINLLALDIRNEVTPRKLFDAVNALKEASNSDDQRDAARTLAALLNLNPEALRERYDPDGDGELDLEKLMKDLTLEGSELEARRKALEEALADEQPGPVEEETPGEETPEEEAAEEGIPEENTIDFQPTPEDGSTANPAEGGTGFLDDQFDPDQFDENELQVIEDGLGDALNELDKARQAAQEAAKQANNKNPGNGKNGGGGGSPPASPPSFPPIGGGGAGGGGSKNPGVQPVEAPRPEGAPPFQPPGPLADAPLSSEVVSALLGRNDNRAASDEQRREDKMNEILDAFRNQSETAISTILQIGQAQMATINRNPSQAVSQVPPQAGGMAERLQSFAPGMRGTSAAGLGPRSQRSPMSAVGNALPKQPQRVLPSRYLRSPYGGSQLPGTPGGRAIRSR